MTIQRSGPTPNFYEYICSFLLIPHSAAPSSALMSLVGPGQQLQWIDIPSFQRGISWDIENVKELFQSSSILLGNAILSQFAIPPGSFNYLPPGQQNYLILVDGLQRFAVGTSVLSVLNKEVLTASPNRPGDATHFTALAARVAPLSPYYIHNNIELSDHPRQAIRDQYKVLRTAVSAYIMQELDAGRGKALADKIVSLFLSRQVALDIYFNFNRQELLSTFIGINTVRVDLGPMDLLRASIIEQSTIALWSQTDMESIENDFTEAFTTEGQKPNQNYIPFINAALKTINKNQGDRLFPSWSSSLSKNDVDALLSFVDKFEASDNPYLREIVLCGKLPASLIFAYYYMDFLHGSKKDPDFFTKGNSGSDADLHAFLICSYRLLIDGTIGRTTDYLEQLLDGSLTVNLTRFSDAVSISFIGKSIVDSLDLQWLEMKLSDIEQKRAPRIFNAMLLNNKIITGDPKFGTSFTPIKFGRAAVDFHVDHLIPDSLLNTSLPGGVQGQSLRNFAPLPTNQNRVAKATNCSSKLSPGGIYESYCTGSTHLIHPYCQWLVSVGVTAKAAALDSQSNLQSNSNPDVGGARIRQIAATLVTKI